MADEWTQETTAPPAKDESAPYGRTSTGAPRGKPGPPKGTRVGGRRHPAAPGKAAPRSPSASRSKPDYRPGIKALLQLIATPLGMIGARTQSLPLVADAAAIHVHSQPLADGLQSVADNDPRVAQLLDKLLKAGPYAVILTPLIGLGLQLGVNHGMIPVELAEQAGAMAPDDLLTYAATGVLPDPARAAPAPAPAPEPDLAAPPWSPAPDPVV